MNASKLKISAILAVGVMFAVAQTPARAATPMTEAFLANVAANLAILDTSSRLAGSRAKSADLAAYAASEMDEAGKVAVALADATPSDHVVATAEAGVLMTGRSVAVVGMTGAKTIRADDASVLEAANGRMPAVGNLDELKQLHGRAFDKLFFITQLDALSQIESDYRTYISQGDDPGIATLAHQQLPALMKRLEALTKI
jgi:hypothetical protein